MEQLSRLDWALLLAEKGFLIFPVQPGAKVPYKGESWTGIMTTDETVIRRWFDERDNTNYGACGGDKFVFLDLDKKGAVNGVERFYAMQAEHDFDEWVDGTLAIDTPSGGRHLALEVPHPVGNSHSFGPGIDVRGAGGYVVGPGCRLANGGEYKVVSDGTDIRRIPSWVSSYLGPVRDKDEKAHVPLGELDTPSAVDRAREYLKKREPAIEGKGGDNHTYKTFCQIKDLGVSETKAVELTVEPLFEDGTSWNDNCVPVWDVAGEKASLSRKARNAYRHGKNRVGDKGDWLMEQDNALPLDIEKAIADIKAEMQKAATKEQTEMDERFAYLDTLMFEGMEITKRKIQREMIIHEYMPAHGFTAVLAKRGVGKTVTMLDMALNMACDRDWQGQDTARGWTAIYLCGEDDVALQDQVDAWALLNNVEPTKGRFKIMIKIADLLSEDDVKLWSMYLKWKIGDTRAVVFIDTWQRATAKGGQNKDEDMQISLHHAEALARDLDGPAVIAFHPPKDGRTTISGSAVTENSSAAILHITDDAAGKRITVIRMKGKGEGNYRLYHFQEVALPRTGQFDKQVFGIVPVPVGGSEDVASGAMSERDREYQKALAEAIYSIAQRKAGKGNELLTHSVTKLAEDIEEMDNVKEVKKRDPIIKKLDEANFKTLRRKTVADEMRRLLADRGEYHYDDGRHSLVYDPKMKGQGGKGRFKFVDPPETPDVSDETLSADSEDTDIDFF